jgi:hypothetical protein|tara:strand:+ start:522 stop:770 length:249 start_codon:yes stop_codon:yes gene_type:complete
MSEVRTVEDRARDYSALADSVYFINVVIAGDQMADEDASERQDCVDRNVEHLELMVARTDWEGEDMTAINSAVSAGNAYTAT